jgi:hypothetical protein
MVITTKKKNKVEKEKKILSAQKKIKEYITKKKK